jgi:hypothetical protein
MFYFTLEYELQCSCLLNLVRYVWVDLVYALEAGPKIHPLSLYGLRRAVLHVVLVCVV